MSQFSLVGGAVTSMAPIQTTANDTSIYTLMPTIPGSNDETLNVVLTSDTLVLDQESAQRGGVITAFYDTMVSMPLTYLPQYWAAALVKTWVGQSAMLDFFDRNLSNSDGTLRPNRFGSTDIRLQNRQRFLGTLGNQLLLVVYSAAIRSIPAQTTPSQVVMLYLVEQGRRAVDWLPDSYEC